MQVHRFLARDANHAIAQIREELGPDAVVAHVRPAPRHGLGRLWGRAELEVLAYLPDPEAEPELPPPPPPPVAPVSVLPPSGPLMNGLDEPILGNSSSRLLERMGLLPIYAERVWEHVLSLHEQREPSGPLEELSWAKTSLGAFWRAPANVEPVPGSEAVEVFIGPCGSGKTTALCKWLTQSVFAHESKAGVWRLDGTSANFATHLDLHCEMLKVPVQRTWAPGMAAEWDQCFIDLPGIDYRDAGAVTSLRSRLGQFPRARVHLCLNSAYSTRLLIEQSRAFDSLPISDLILTHLDEERSWGKLWNLVVGTKYTIRYLAAGQNVPGDFRLASAEQLFRGHFLA
jgi:flagellar biosynthesis protein FlhF